METKREEFEKAWRESGLIDQPTVAETEAAYKGYKLALASLQSPAVQEPFWYAVVSKEAPIINKAIKSEEVAQEYADKCRETYSGIEIVPLYASPLPQAAQPDGYMPKDMSEAKRMIVQLRGALADAKASVAAGLSDEQIIDYLDAPGFPFDSLADSEKRVLFASVRALLSLASKQKVVEGFVVVPMEPTEAMKQAGYYAAPYKPGLPNPYHAITIYKAMIAAAPMPKQEG